MNNYKKYYEEKLYPLQNGILKCVQDSATQFYLSGGTALSRGSFNHRYSDDIDLFLENDPAFKDQSEKLISIIKSRGYNIITPDMVVSEDFISFSAGHQNFTNAFLKIDLINDTAKRFGELVETPVFSSTDNWRNILSNKLCASAPLREPEIELSYAKSQRLQRVIL